MSPAPQWPFVGSVPENYERYLVPTIFGPWAHSEVSQKEVEFILALRSNDPSVGYNQWPKFKG